MSPQLPWYLVRTKRNKENYVKQRLLKFAPEVFLPMLQLPRSTRGRQLVPLFPQYIFARLDLPRCYFDTYYMPGVSGVVSTESQPLVIAEEIIDEVRSRSTDGIVVLQPRVLRTGEHVRVTAGAFRDFEAMFERYMSGTKRVVLLIQALGGSGIRVIADASIVATR